MRIYVKRELFCKIGTTIYITDKSGKRYSRKDLERELGINIRKQQSMIKKNNSSGNILNPMETWSLELICNLAKFLGYKTDELIDEQCIEEYKEEVNKNIMDAMERRKIW